MDSDIDIVDGDLIESFASHDECIEATRHKPVTTGISLGDAESNQRGSKIKSRNHGLDFVS